MTNAMQKHEAFILDTVLPNITKHSQEINCDMLEAALATFMALGTILLDQGMSADGLMAAIKGSALTTHDAPEGLQ